MLPLGASRVTILAAAMLNLPKLDRLIIVHYLNNSRSQRILWLLEELDLQYEVQHYDRDPQTMLAPGSLRCPLNSYLSNFKELSVTAKSFAVSSL
jgi:hypothetical protein